MALSLCGLLCLSGCGTLHPERAAGGLLPLPLRKFMPLRRELSPRKNMTPKMNLQMPGRNKRKETVSKRWKHRSEGDPCNQSEVNAGTWTMRFNTPCQSYEAGQTQMESKAVKLRRGIRTKRLSGGASGDINPGIPAGAVRQTAYQEIGLLG